MQVCGRKLAAWQRRCGPCGLREAETAGRMCVEADAKCATLECQVFPRRNMTQHHIGIEFAKACCIVRVPRLLIPWGTQDFGITE